MRKAFFFKGAFSAGPCDRAEKAKRLKILECVVVHRDDLFGMDASYPVSGGFP
jgi:hypothetical protein